MGKEKKDRIRPVVDLYHLSKGDIEKLGTKKQLHEELEATVGLDKFKEMLQTCVDSKGTVYVYIKEKKIVAYYFFIKEDHEEKKSKHKVYQYRLLEEGLISKYEDQYVELKEQVSSSITGDMSFNDVLTLIWDEERVDLETLSNDNNSMLSAVPMALLGYAIGIMLWIMTGEIYWLGIGLCFAVAFGGAGTALSAPKKKTENNGQQASDSGETSDDATSTEDSKSDKEDE